MPDWAATTVGEIAEIFDGPHATPEKVDSGPWFLSISSLNHGLLDLHESAHLSEDDFQRWTRRVTPRFGDVLFSYETRLGEAALMPAGIRACLGRRMALLRPDQGKVDFRFLLYSYLGPQFQDLLRERTVHGATVDRILLAELPSWPIRLPELPAQRAIAATLGAIDDKIAVNDRVVRTCDVVRSLRVDNWMRAHPVMTGEHPLSSVAEFVNGRAYTKDASRTGRMVIRIAEINSGPGASTVYNDIEVPDQNVARPGDVLFAWSGSLTVTRWFRPEAIINQHIFKVLPNDGVPMWLAFELIRAKLAIFRGIAAGKATTMGHIQRHHLDEPVTVPFATYFARLDAELGPLWDRALAAEQESLTLAELRNVLLPKLMSGEIRVRDAERVVEDAT